MPPRLASLGTGSGRHRWRNAAGSIGTCGEVGEDAQAVIAEASVASIRLLNFMDDPRLNCHGACLGGLLAALECLGCTVADADLLHRVLRPLSVFGRPDGVGPPVGHLKPAAEGCDQQAGGEPWAHESPGV